MQELNEIEEESLELAEAGVITTPERMAAAKRYKIFCPFSGPGGCKIRGRGSLVRPESFERHVERCARMQGIHFTRKQRKA